MPETIEEYGDGDITLVEHDDAYLVEELDEMIFAVDKDDENALDKARHLAIGYHEGKSPGALESMSEE